VKWRQAIDAWQVRKDFARNYPDMVAHLGRDARVKLIDGSLLQAGYAAYWKRDLASAQRIFRTAIFRTAWQIRDAKYLIPSLLPSAVYHRLIGALDRP
jgi:hypothetical protein